MKNLPHQYSNLNRITAALATCIDLIKMREDLSDDGILGEAFVAAKVHTFRGGATLATERKKPKSNQGFRTAAREMRRFFLAMKLISTNRGTWSASPLALKIISKSISNEHKMTLWKIAMMQLAVTDADGNTSHPYKILLKLASDFPTLEKPKFLLALEAKNDGIDEYNRIIKLANQPLDSIRKSLKITEHTARNAIKILPPIAIQIGDLKVKKSTAEFQPNTQASEDAIFDPVSQSLVTQSQPYSKVSAGNISKIPTFANLSGAKFDLSAGIEMRQKRTEEHHLALQNIAALFETQGFDLYENPYDCLANKSNAGSVLIEMKTLDGSLGDEKRQTEKALGQLKSYEHYDVDHRMKSPKIIEMAAFTQAPRVDTISLLKKNNVEVSWIENGQWLTVEGNGGNLPLEPTAVLTSS